TTWPCSRSPSRSCAPTSRTSPPGARRGECRDGGFDVARTSDTAVMTNHHCTCEECERRRQQAGDEAFADMVVLAHYHPEWFHFGEHHVHDHGHHDTGAFGDDELDDDVH